MMTTQNFDDLTDVYEAMIDWPKRLAAEEPFYRRLFDRVGVESVVDVACGTGRHAAMFHSWGLRVEGADVSPNMIRRARDRFGEPPGLRWAVRGFDEPIDAAAPFDAAVCVGNSLALAPDKATARRALEAMLTALRPNGVVVIHVLNLWHLPDGPCVWQKCLPVSLPQGESLVVKGIHRSGSRGFVELVVTPLPRAETVQTESVPFLGLEADELKEICQEAGAARVECFGGYQDQPYDRRASTDLIMVAMR
ncbi:MAG: class I SAM-dependent DNA methyltransferase [Planctomycetota bacterium]|jgi:SAM-dependent methyltransferase